MSFNMVATVVALSRIVRYDVVAKRQAAEQGGEWPEEEVMKLLYDEKRRRDLSPAG